jgi:ankyrin repeat protein
MSTRRTLIGINWTKFVAFICFGRQEIVQVLVERGANVNELDYKNMTPLKLAVRWGHTHMHSCNI